MPDEVRFAKSDGMPVTTRIHGAFPADAGGRAVTKYQRPRAPVAPTTPDPSACAKTRALRIGATCAALLLFLGACGDGLSGFVAGANGAGEDTSGATTNALSSGVVEAAGTRVRGGRS